MSNIDKLHGEALAQGYKDETCSECGVEFLAHIHFVRCSSQSCPMKSKTDTRSLLDRIRDGN